MARAKGETYDLFRLPNGIRCVHRRVPVANGGVSVAHIALTIGAGTRDEATEQHGVAHLVEHLLFKGTGRRTAWQVNSLLENAGGELNAFTTKEETVIHATLLSSEFLKSADLLSDMAFNSTFSAVELEKEREVILDEINSYKDSPADLIYDEFEELLFAESPLGRNILGDKRSLRRLGRETLIAYCRQNYRPEEVVFSASSSLTHRRFREICGRYFSKIEMVQSSKNERIEPVHIKEKFSVFRSKKTHQAHAILGGYAYSLKEPKRMQLAFLINLLGGPASVSRLNLELRERHALTYSVEANYVPYSDSGFFTIYLGCDREKADKSLDLVRAELKKLRDIPLTLMQLSRAKKQFLGQLAISSESPENLMLGIAKSLLVYDSFDSTAEIAAKIQTITAKELQEVAMEIFAEDRLNTLVYR